MLSKIKVVLFVLLGLFFIYMGVVDYIGLKNTTLDINQMTEAEFNMDEYVKGEIKYCLGSFAQEYEEEHGVEKKTAGFYIVPLEKSEKYLVVEASRAECKYLEDISEETLKMIESDSTIQPTPLKINSKVRKYDKELNQYLKTFFEVKTDKEVEELVIPYYINIDDNSSAMSFCGIGGVCLIIALCMFFKIRKSRGL